MEQKKVFEAQFNNQPKSIDRTLAFNKDEALKNFNAFYPNDQVTKIYEP